MMNIQFLFLTHYGFDPSSASRVIELCMNDATKMIRFQWVAAHIKKFLIHDGLSHQILQIQKWVIATKLHSDEY